MFIFNPIDCTSAQTVPEEEYRIINTTVSVRPGMLTAECTAPMEIPVEDIMTIWWYEKAEEGFKVSGGMLAFLYHHLHNH